ncbi:MAG TPA: sigma-70 family RNA polymerase sigma factor [Nocardioidaceae bacterium]|nr:sigma-70 family RNA polymerase sigma factor [Nocardioidaceae bacterium]
MLNLPVAESIARRYAGRGEPLEDLLQVAAMALTKAVQRFDPHRGHDFLSFAVPTIRGEIKRYFRDNGWTVRPPRGLQELRQRIGPAVDELSQQLHRAPRPSEIAKHLGVNAGDVCEALATDGCYSPSSLDDRGTDDGAADHAAILGQDDPGLVRAEAVALLGPVCRRLRPRERHLLYLRFFRGWTQSEIAAELGLSQMQISRLLGDLLTRLRAELEPTEQSRETIRSTADVA